MSVRFRRIHEITRLAHSDGHCYLCKKKAEFKFSWCHNMSFPFRFYCRTHAERASKRHKTPMPEEE